MSQPILAVAFGVYMIGTGVVLLLSLYDDSEELFRLFVILMLPVVCLITMAVFADQAKRERVEKSKLPTITNFEERKFVKEVLELTHGSTRPMSTGSFSWSAKGLDFQSQMGRFSVRR